MRNRLVYAAVGIVGVLLIGLAIASATVWRADSVLRASARADQPIVVTDPGVLEMAGDPVTVTATVPAGDHVVLAVGRDTDVLGWVGTAEHQRVSGLAGWHALALAAPTGSPSPSGAPVPAGSATASASAPVPAAPSPTASATGAAGAAPPAGASQVPDAATSDMWVTSAQGTGSASLTWRAQPGRWSLLVVGSTSAGAGVPPTLAFAWPRTVTTPYLVPGTVVGSLLVLVAMLLLWRDLRRRRDIGWTAVATGAIPVVTAAAGLTRRQMREMAELARTGQLPTVAAPAVPSDSTVPDTATATRRGDATEPQAAHGAGTPGAVDTAPAHGEPTPRAAVAPTAASDEPGPRPYAVAGPATSSEEPGPRPRAVAGPAASRDEPPAHAADDPASGSAPSEGVAASGASRWLRRRRPTAPAPEQGAVPPGHGSPQQSAPRPSASWAPRPTGATTLAPAAGPAAVQPPVPAVGPVAAPMPAVAHGGSQTVPVPPAVAVGAHEAPPTAPVPAAGTASRPPAPGGRRARRQAAERAATGSVEVATAPGVSTTTTSAQPAPGVPAAASTQSVPGVPEGAPVRPARPAWMRGPSPATPVPATPVPAAPPNAAPPAPLAPPAPVRPTAAPRTGGASGTGAQPAWLSRVAARWEREDAEAEVEDEAAHRGSPRLADPSPDGPPPAAGSTSSALRPSWTTTPDASPAGVATAPATPPEPAAGTPQAEASRADAWRRAWGLPPLDTEEDR